MRFLLKLTPWKLFFLCVIIPFILWLVTLYSAAAIISSRESLVSITVLPFLGLGGSLVFILSYFGWVYAIGTELYKQVPWETASNLKWFKSSVRTPPLFLFLIGPFLVWLFSTSNANNTIVFSLLFILSVFLLLNAFYFAAKMINSIELGRAPNFEEILLDLLLFIFFPIGIWFLQPRILKIMYAPEKEDDISRHLIE